MGSYRLTATLVLIAFSACRAQVPNDTVAAPTDFGDFEFVIPAKWSRGTPDREKTKAILLLNGTNWSNADGVIMVDVGKPAGSAQELAKALAGKDGKVFPNKVVVDKVEGIKLESTSENLLRPKFAVVVFRDSKAYLIMAAQKPGTNVSDAFDQAVKSWKWKREK